MDCIRRIVVTVTSVWLISFACVASAQDQGEAEFRSANEQFRSGNFVGAREAYESAIAAGFDSALLRYNLGIAHYRLGDYTRAELALQQAAEDPRLAPMAIYNIGLANLADDRMAAAESRFQQVIRISPDPDLSELAARALASARANQRSETRSTREAIRRPAYREPDPPVGDLYFLIAARYGTDDNVYRTPSSSYIDLAQTGQPLVTPAPQSAGFVPVDMLVHYRITAEDQGTEFDFSYRLNGDFYDSAFSNANLLTQRFEMGANVDLEGRHSRRLEADFFAVSHDETNFDPDTGVDRDINGQDISDRFSYRGAGLDASYEQSMSRWAFGFDTRLERRGYRDTVLVTRYDHEFYHLNLWGARELNARTELFFAAKSYRREYDARRARNSAGVLLLTSPTLEYVYSAGEVGVERRFSELLSLTASIHRVERTDNFEGYSDYSQSSVQLSLDYEPNRRMRVRFLARLRSYDYPNAFAFNDPAGGALEVDSTNAEVDFEYRFTSRLAVWSEILMRDDSSTDPRVNYARNRVITGIKWRL
jgi:tetratricopeptide (TPR) repeat protein